MRGIALWMLLAAAVFPACEPLGQHPASNTPALAALPPQGIYEGCEPGTRDCLNRLKTLAHAGFQLVLNYSSVAGSAAEILAYANQAQAAGIKIIWSLS